MTFQDVASHRAMFPFFCPDAMSVPLLAKASAVNAELMTDGLIVVWTGPGPVSAGVSPFLGDASAISTATFGLCDVGPWSTSGLGARSGRLSGGRDGASGAATFRDRGGGAGC